MGPSVANQTLPFQDSVQRPVKTLETITAPMTMTYAVTMLYEAESTMVLINRLR